jgi:2-polyprenyl-6-methoxyphenol hydroxylase-like FAD-dependent oxidoreductase
MEGVLADSMSEKAENPQVFLAGDAAHAFPPSGGFGMNTGICDAQNLAHKIASSIQFDDNQCLKTYDPERRLVGRLTRDFSMLNHDKAIKIAKMLNLNKGNMDLYESAVGFLPSFLQKPALYSGMTIGLNVGLSLASTKKV